MITLYMCFTVVTLQVIESNDAVIMPYVSVSGKQLIVFNSIFFPQGSISGKKSSKRKLGKIFDRDSKVCKFILPFAISVK